MPSLTQLTTFHVGVFETLQPRHLSRSDATRFNFVSCELSWQDAKYQLTLNVAWANPFTREEIAFSTVVATRGRARSPRDRLRRPRETTRAEDVIRA